MTGAVRRVKDKEGGTKDSHEATYKSPLDIPKKLWQA